MLYFGNSKFPQQRLIFVKEVEVRNFLKVLNIGASYFTANFAVVF